jgi:ribosomal protein L29
MNDKDDISLESLLNRSLEILKREITNLMMASANGKLNGTSGRDLVAYVKLLSDLQNKKSDELSEMSDEDLEKVLKDVKSKRGSKKEIV